MVQAMREAGDEHLSVARMCDLVSVSRSSYYRACLPADGSARDLDLRDRLQRIALEWPSYGYRRVTAELARQGVEVNHKRVLRLMRQDNLLCLRKRRFVRTTDSNHGYAVYPNIAAELDLQRPNQLWVSDITYIRLQYEFVYLAVILDAFSRKCVGWAMGRRIDTELTLAALRMAINRRRPQPGLVHHSDQGVQYAAGQYTDLLHSFAIRISMSRRGNPYDNARAESFMKTLKYEEAYLFEYRNLEEARERIAHFLESVYNEKRLHSALGYVPPTEFENQFLTQQTTNRVVIANV
jgi:transposase InsO family protein